MGIKELLESIKLVDVQLKLKDFFKGNQTGIVNINNVKIEKNYYITVPPNTKFWENFAATTITPEIEKQAKQIAENKLTSLSTELDLLPTEVALNIATTATATSTMIVIKKELKEDSDKS